MSNDNPYNASSKTIKKKRKSHFFFVKKKKGWRMALITFTALYLLFLLRNTLVMMTLPDFPKDHDDNSHDFTSGVATTSATTSAAVIASNHKILRLPDNNNTTTTALVVVESHPTLRTIPEKKILQTSTEKVQYSRNLSLASSFMDNDNTNNGGFIFFLHIPKTGGSTIRKNLEERDGITYHFVSGKGLYLEIIPQIKRYLSSTPKITTKTTSKQQPRNIVIFEVHGRDSPNLLELHKTLLKLKRTAAQHNIPTFFFTILRDPMAYAISYFNFFHVQYGTKQKYFPQVSPTESNLLQYTLYNPQCQFLARGEFSLRNISTPHKKQMPSEQECNDVHKVLLETMDWVGTTERLDVEILPMLRRILSLTSDFEFRPFMVSKKGFFVNESSISYNELSQGAIDTIQSMNILDYDLYEKLRREFVFTGLP